MMRTKRHRTFSQGMMLGILLVIMVASPVSIPFMGTGGENLLSIASAQGTTPAPAEQQSVGGAVFNALTSCSSVGGYINPLCWFRYLLQFLAAMLIYVSTWILSLSGVLFNWLVGHTIIQFGELYGTIKPAVEQAWTAFRDIANIAIIGIFTFIAISIILGLKEYGQKKMIANVLIIAVLINFSLLFTKMIVDASNFTAQQIYTAAGLGFTQGNGAGDTAASKGIAGQFTTLLGIGTIGQTVSSVNQVGRASDSTMVVVLYALFMFAIVFGASAVLLYGSFLLVSRAVMLIFLMVTAAIAFASYLIPKGSGSHYGWDAWWSSLLWCATLAPILMFFLWMTLNVSSVIHTGAAKGSLGDLVANPTNPANIGSFFAYLMILGMLFATFKISSMAANKIGGFSMAQMATALPFTMSSRFLAAPLFRQTAGWLGAKYQGARLGEMKDARRQASQARRDEAEAFKNMSPMAAKYGADARKFEQLAASKLKASKTGGLFADGKMNLMDAPGVKAALGQVGVKGFAAGASVKDTKSYEGQQKARAEAAEKLAAKAAPSAADNEKAKTEARRVVREQRETAEAQLEATRRAEKTAAEQIKQTEQLPSKLAAAEQNASNVRDSAEQNKAVIASDTTLSATQQKTQLDAEDRRIKAAEADVKQIQRGIEAVEGPWKKAETALKDHQKETGRLAEDAAKTIVAAMGDAGENIAEIVGQKSGDILTRTLGSATGANEEIGKKTRELYKKKISTASLTSVISQLQADSPAPTPPPTTP